MGHRAAWAKRRSGSNTQAGRGRMGAQEETMEYKYGELQDWDEAEIKTGSDFMKLVEGDNVVRIITKPYQFTVAWITDPAGIPRKVRSALGRNCPLVKRGDKLQNRWYVGVIDRKDKKAKILEISSQITSAIKKFALDADCGDPRGYDVNISRGAPNSQPLYTVINKPKKPLTDDEGAMVAKFLENTDLKRMTAPPTPEEVAERLAAIEGGQAAGGRGRGGQAARGNAGGKSAVDQDLFNFDEEQI